MKSSKNIFSNNWARITHEISDTTSGMNLLSYICSLCVSPLPQIHSLKRKCKINVLCVLVEKKSFCKAILVVKFFFAAKILALHSTQTSVYGKFLLNQHTYSQEGSQNHRGVDVGRELWRLFISTPLLKQVLPEQIAQGHIHIGFEYFQRGKLQNLFRQPALGFCQPQCREDFPHI